MEDDVGVATGPSEWELGTVQTLDLELWWPELFEGPDKLQLSATESKKHGHRPVELNLILTRKLSDDLAQV